MKSEESTFTVFNFYFTTFPRQVFVNIFDGVYYLYFQLQNLVNTIKMIIFAEYLISERYNSRMAGQWVLPAVID